MPKKMTSHTTAAIIIIGDEILEGEVQDTNSYFLCQELKKCDVKVVKISTIPDDVQVIADEVSKLSSQCTYVLTSGGIGPTHDDVTYEGIAEAFQEELFAHKEYEEIMQMLCATETSDEETVTRMCYIPRSGIMHHTKNYSHVFIPIISVRNVFIFPGIPSYLRKAFTSLKSLFISNTKYFFKNIFLNVNEFDITHQLNDLVSQFDGVQFGSYCNTSGCPHYDAKVTLKSESESLLNQAEAYLRSTFPQNCIISPVSARSKEAMTDLHNLLQSTSEDQLNLAKAVHNSLSIIEDCFSKYSPKEISICFNGGKDCTALLHLVTYLSSQKKVPSKLQAIYIHSEDMFSEVDGFVQLTAKRYDLDLFKYNLPMKEALAKLKVDHPEIKCTLLGTRHSDPHGTTLKSFQMTDSNWPQFMRVSPILDWTYDDIWQFLRLLNIPYCSLYDRGYTSIGCCNNTLPNAQLKAVTAKGKEFYQPAYLLADSSAERQGRISS